MQTIVVVNGAHDWRSDFPGVRVVQTSIGRSRWLLDRGQLWIVDAQGNHKPDAILWRLGAIEPEPMHRACLEMIRLSGVACVNDADVLLRGYDRLSMLFEMKSAGLPVIDFDVHAGQASLQLNAPHLPAVLKLGNLHGGLGKARIRDNEHWQEMTGLVSMRHGYATTEPFIDYRQDVRCLAVGPHLWAMVRKSHGWKANVDTVSFDLIEPPQSLRTWTRQAMTHLGADVLGLDFLETPAGEWLLLENNDVPGVRGFPRAVTQAIARQLFMKLAQ